MYIFEFCWGPWFGGWREHKTNVVGTLNMLGLAKRVGARFLLTSTSEVYGDPLQHPQVETYWGNVNPIGASSPLLRILFCFGVSRSRVLFLFFCLLINYNSLEVVTGLTGYRTVRVSQELVRVSCGMWLKRIEGARLPYLWVRIFTVPTYWKCRRHHLTLNGMPTNVILTRKIECD